MICTRCGNNEADTATFCGRCGAPMGRGGRGARGGNQGGGRRVPDVDDAGNQLSQMAYIHDKESMLTWVMQRPLFGALGLGAIAAVIAVGAIVLASGKSAVKQPNGQGNLLLTPQSGQGGGIDLAPTPGGGGANSGGGGAATPVVQPTQPPASTPEAAQPTATPQPPPPTPTPEPLPPTSTPQPPPPTPTPQPPPPTPTPLPPVTVPPAKTSTRAAIAISNGQGSTHKIGEQVQICYTVVNTQKYRLYDTSTPGDTLDQGVGNGAQKCLTGTVTPPVGADTIRIDALSTTNAVIDFASVSIIVVP